LEYWSGKEKALVFGLIALVAILAAALYVEALQAAQLNAALQRAVQNAALAQHLANQGVTLSAKWIVDGDKCILRLHMPVSPGRYIYAYKRAAGWQGNSSSPGGYYAGVALYAGDQGQIVAVLHWYNLTDPELWFDCPNGTVKAVYQERFVFPNGSLFEMGAERVGRYFFPASPNCEGICNPVPLNSPLAEPTDVVLLMQYFPPSWDGYAWLTAKSPVTPKTYFWPFVVELPLQVERVH